MVILAFWFSDDYDCVPVSLRASKYVCLYTTYSYDIEKSTLEQSSSFRPRFLALVTETEISNYPRIVVFPSP